MSATRLRPAQIFLVVTPAIIGMAILLAVVLARGRPGEDRPEQRPPEQAARVPAALRNTRQAPAPSGKRVWDREKLANALHHLKPWEVREKLGDPDHVDSIEDIWTYKGISRDPRSGEVDSECGVCFGGFGSVQMMTFPR